MRRLNAVVLLLLFSLHCIGAHREQGVGNSGGDHTVSLAFESFVTRCVFVAEDFITNFSLT